MVATRDARESLGELAARPQPAAVGRAAAAPTAKAARGGGWVLAALWLLALGFVALTAANYHSIAVAGDRLEAWERAHAGNPADRTAFAAYAAAQPPMMFDPDSQCWIALTRDQIAEGSLRPRVYRYDNAPYGHRQHWSASFNWWLLLVGGATRLLTGLPLAEAMARSAAWANPILLAVFLSALALVLRRRLGPWPLGILLVTLAALTNVEWDFSYGRPDHHGLHLMAFSGLVLGALTAGLGWVLEEDSRSKVQGPREVQVSRFKVQAEEEEEAGWHLARPRTPREARAWFTASGMCGGVGLWIGSTQQCICIAALGAGAVLGALLFARRAEPDGGVRFEPGLWRRWARAGAATSLFFYLLEGLPDHLEMRLEVNHPFFALAWLGAGELMYVILRLKVPAPAPEAAGPRRENLWRRTALGLLGMGVLPLALAFGPKAWSVLSDPLLLNTPRLVAEGRPWIDPLGWGVALHLFWDGTGALLLGLPLAAAVCLLRRRDTPPPQLAGLAALAVMAGIFLGWTLLQNRWLGFLEVTLAVLAVAVAPCVPRLLPRASGRRRGALPALLTLLALAVPGWAGFGSVQADVWEENPLAHANLLLTGMMSAKEAAWNLRRRAETLGLGRPARVMAQLAVGPALHYYGGLDAVGSFYWDNLAGCYAGADFFLDETGEGARRLARERGLDFVLVTARPAFILEWQSLRRGRTDLAAARRTLGYRLSNPTAKLAPDWLEEMPLVDAPLAVREGVRIYRVVKEKL